MSNYRNIDDFPDLMKLKHLGMYFKMSPITIRRRMKAGTFFIKMFRGERGHWCARKSDVRNLIQS